LRNYCTSLGGHWLKSYRAEHRLALKPSRVPSATQKKLVRLPYDAAY
jgi:hypothetical protein